MRENEIEKYLKKEVNKIGGLCYKFTSFENGVPDRIVVHRGTTVFVELKNETGRTSKIQDYQHMKIKDAGADIVIISSKEEVAPFIEKLKKRAWLYDMQRGWKAGDAK